MSSRTKHRKLSYLSLALVLASFTALQCGHALPAVSKSPQTKVVESIPGANRISGSAPKSSFEQENANPGVALATKASPKINNKKKKKKTKTARVPPSTRKAMFQRPIFDPQSLPDFLLQPFDTPWRHRLAYSLEWSVGPAFLDHIAAAPRDRSIADDSPLQLELQAGPDDEEDQKEAVAAAAAAAAVKLGRLIMDIHLIPLDPAKSSELLLSRVPLSSLQARVQIPTDIPPGWYRLEIRFWDEGATATAAKLSRSERAGNNKKPEVLDISVPNPTLQPPRAKSMIFAQQVGIWRGKEAIEVTSLNPDHQEWDEFVETISHETQQGRWSGRDWERKDSLVDGHPGENEFRAPKSASASSPQYGGLKALMFGPWMKNMLSTKMTPPNQASFERTQFPQESFRFKEAMDFITSRAGTPDFDEDELEMDLEEEKVEHGQSLQKLKKIKTLEELDELVALWSETAVEIVDDDSMDQDESYGAPSQGLSDLRIRIEHGQDTMESDGPMTWRANRDRTVSWQTSEPLVQDHVLLAVELIKAPAMTSAAGPAQASVTPIRVRTRAELIQRSIEQPRTALLTDRVPASWGAAVVRIPTWVSPGTYQLRLKGVGDLGVEWADVSQPFAVQSDPYLYF